MCYCSVEEVKLKSWIPESDTTQDSRIEFIISWTKWLVDKFLWWDYNYGKKYQDIDLCDLRKTCCCDNKFNLNIPQVVSIDKINDVDYDWILWEDYIITWHRKDTIIINNFKNTLPDNDFCIITVEYTAWYKCIPSDLAYAHATIVEWQLAEQAGRKVVTEKLWPRSVTFANATDATTFKNIIGLFAPIHV